MLDVYTDLVDDLTGGGGMDLVHGKKDTSFVGVQNVG